MPDLPAKTLTQAHFDKIVKTFPGATLAEKSAAYDNWLTNRLIERVRQQELAKVQRDNQVLLSQAEANIIAALPPLRPEPDIPPL